MTRAARWRLRAPWLVAVFVGALVARAHGRSLAQQQDASLQASNSFTDATENNVWGGQSGSTSAMPTDSTSFLPFAWFQQQLNAFAALEHAVMQRLNQGMDATYGGTQEELLRHVGCARMRAAMLNKAMQQGSEVVTGIDSDSPSTSAGGVSDSDGSSANGDGYEYFEDYSVGIVSSRAAYAGSDARLRGAGSVDEASMDIEGASLSTSRGLYDGSDGDDHSSDADGFSEYGAYYAVDEEDSAGEDDEYELEIEDQYIEAYEYSEYYIEGYSDDSGYYETDEGDSYSNVFSSLSAKRGGQTLRQGAGFQDQYYGLEGRVLKLLEGAYAMMFGDQEGISTARGAVKALHGKPAAEAALSSAGAVSNGKAAASAAASLATDAALGAGSSAAQFGYDSYDMLDQADLRAGLNAMDDESLYFGYEYDLYNDYYQTITLADIMLSEMEMDSEDDDEWADYLEQAYEYFTLYMDDGDEVTFFAHGATVEDMPNAVAALATIAELVVWAHLGNFELEVQPAYTLSTISDDGAVLESKSVFFISTETYNEDTFTVITFDEEWDALQAEQPVDVVHDMNLRWFAADGSLNWGLVTLVILGAGTLAMLVGFVASWIALRRTMRLSQGWVYVPHKAAGKGGCGFKVGYESWGKVGKGGKGFDNGSYAAPLLTLRPEDCHGAVVWGASPATTATVEDASMYVSPTLSNDSVAKALCK